ncbi:sigma-70 family RNA polymerase sigma factor [Clostridium tarantellae]|uniref:Sigma-70 family RNA polymerase sigma factor n=1 Tax=Clostridium tarantellae TaxID=39493 RepID=A0A6I1MNF1_9CLOT|nr:sigma-70 family RNA polymerase sigma factor [Clostridium tarantellae]MPQ44554.1 sigma-70 family RNA polymerase sigma factor [Clostridium tarantellae]
MIQELKVKKAIKGNEQAFEELINDCKENLYKTAFAYVKNEEQALDIVGETIYKAYTSIEKLKEPKYFNTWITRILINTTLTYIKKNSRIVYLEDNVTIKDIPCKQQDLVEKMYIWQAIDSLEHKHKEIIILKYFDDLTVSEISKVLDYPIGTVKTYLNKALTKLRSFMREDVM